MSDMTYLWVKRNAGYGELKKEKRYEQKQEPVFPEEKRKSVSTLEDWVQIWVSRVLPNVVKANTRTMDSWRRWSRSAGNTGERTDIRWELPGS